MARTWQSTVVAQRAGQSFPTLSLLPLPVGAPTAETKAALEIRGLLQLSSDNLPQAGKQEILQVFVLAADLMLKTWL